MERPPKNAITKTTFSIFKQIKVIPEKEVTIFKSNLKWKGKSAYEPSGPSGQILSRFL